MSALVFFEMWNLAWNGVCITSQNTPSLSVMRVLQSVAFHELSSSATEPCVLSSFGSVQRGAKFDYCTDGRFMLTYLTLLGALPRAVTESSGE